MTNPDIDALVQSGTYVSKGAARRALGIDEGLPPLSEDMRAWLGCLLAGLTGARPQLPNKAR